MKNIYLGLIIFLVIGIVLGAVFLYFDLGANPIIPTDAIKI